MKKVVAVVESHFMFEENDKERHDDLNQNTSLEDVYNNLCQKSVSAFHLFNQPISVSIDLEKVEDIYFDYQEKFHPDNFTEECKKLKATQICKKLNDLCECLYKPFCRLEMMLESAGFSREKINAHTVQSSHMLHFMFDLKDELEEATSKGEVECLIEKVNRLIVEGEKKFQMMYDQKLSQTIEDSLIMQYQELCFLYKTLISAKEKNQKLK